MDIANLMQIKILYYPYTVVKKAVCGPIHYAKYISSLHHIKKNKISVQNKIDRKEVLNVVFVVQYIPGWNKLEPIYTKMKKDDRFNPIIVCVPLNIQNHQLMDHKGNDTYRYFIEQGYEAIDALEKDGGWYDLKQLEPDYLFHSRPYNHFMPKPYTSGKIVKYALICNVLYGLSFTTDMLPVTINKNYYRDVYCYFSADINESDFYKKRFNLGFKHAITCCQPFGAIGLEQMLKYKTEKNNRDFRKTVLWTPRWSTDVLIGGSNFFNYRDIIISFAENKPDVLFILRPHPLMFGNFIKTGEMTEKEVNEFKIYCHNKENIILDEEKEYAETFWKSDFLITDVSSIIPEYFVTEKPIIYCHSDISFHYLDASDAIIKSAYEVRNAEELKNHITNLLEDRDEKQEQRRKVMDKFYKEVSANSANIIDKLVHVNTIES